MEIKRLSLSDYNFKIGFMECKTDLTALLNLDIYLDSLLMKEYI
jgi:hypothetical protein